MDKPPSSFERTGDRRFSRTAISVLPTELLSSQNYLSGDDASAYELANKNQLENEKLLEVVNGRTSS